MPWSPSPSVVLEMGHVIVVGSGVAGLTAALTAAAHHRVTLVTKQRIGDSNSWFAQGGVAVALGHDDSAAAHIADTLAAGDGGCHSAAVEVLCREGADSIRRLIELGMPFDRAIEGDTGSGAGDDLARAQEGAHSRPRILHASGDATGRVMVQTLVAAVRARNIELVEERFLVDIEIENGRTRGVRLAVPDGSEHSVEGDAVIIATGGAGMLFEHTTNPSGATGDGIAAAARAGAVLADLEFMQFHPTALAVPGTPLISEAVRGEGAVLLDRAGRRFMMEVHPDAELAPRDVVARAIAECQRRQPDVPVMLDATSIGADRLVERFPGLTAACARHGFDWTSEPVPVTPAAHYLMGGVHTDLDGRSSVQGLFAVGEAACTGVHGANRLASNSLLEALVFARRAATAVDAPWPHGSPSSVNATPLPPHDSLGDAAAGVAATPVDRLALRRAMWELVGLHRNVVGLESAAELFSAWTAPPAPSSFAEREDANLLQLARAMTAAAMARKGSLGAHFRTDASATADGSRHDPSGSRQEERRSRPRNDPQDHPRDNPQEAA
ncbi:L-aspartate oxidase [Ruicaihuangia caeni]|uniref:L-aspartate oxidase n=1 Tax=Ruicaihuangia caeni TaxID=3042517 RepID=A0AAW6T5I3_9MICO|nr:L-aspartate oxidase [Klugiella sp. YN-L-19]MDI2097946.1 L-aspartate oxidase [Klugiella sp. YN-L-19]